jgi:hypothetical protein
VSKNLTSFICRRKIDHFQSIFRLDFGLSGAIADNSWIGQNSNSYAIQYSYVSNRCWLAGEEHRFELPEGAIRPEIRGNENVYGCGLVLDPDNILAIFFTLNGQLLSELVLEILRINNERISCIYISN